MSITQRVVEISRLTSYVYKNWGEAPDTPGGSQKVGLNGWVPLDNTSELTLPTANGFYAEAFGKGNEIVISFRGTDSIIDWVSQIG